MGVAISYMGTKRGLADDVATAIAGCKAGPVLDAFSGMCSVGEAVGTARPVWTNDAQQFAAEVGRALFTSREYPLASSNVADRYHDSYRASLAKLSSGFEPLLEQEVALISASSFCAFDAANSSFHQMLSKVDQKAQPAFASLYSGGYFGLRQALEIDALLATFKWSGVELNMSDQSRWHMLALGRAMLRVSNSPGHFAQYLTPKASNYRVFQKQRKRSIWNEWLLSHDELEPIGNVDWRKGNRSFNQDSVTLLRTFRSEREAPAVVYADPPYTNDQYSRYYHVFETLALADIPVIYGKGRYRSDRFVTAFSLKSKAAEMIDQLGQATAAIGADLVLSYPTNGLAYGKAEFDPIQTLKRSYGTVELFKAISHGHSTFGASKGSAKAQVTEMIYVARS